jgi:hypothetical protein
VRPLSVDPSRISKSVGHRRITVCVRFPRIALVIGCAMSLAFPLAAQSPNGTINGRVVDPANGVIAGADILAINDVTGVKYPSKTNEDGIYVVPNLPPGPYRLQVAKVGFKTLIKPDIVLNIQDALSINFTLPVGAVFETVTVEGGAAMVNTSDASVSTVVDQTYVKNMPLNGRSFQDLILLTPGVVTQTPQLGALSQLGATGEFSVNGQRPESNYYTVDGVSANTGAAPGISMVGTAGASGSVAAATALGTTQALVSVDDLQEFRIQSSTYSAEYGRNPGGQFAFETKSGTNLWHGTAYDYVRNGIFDANDWFNDYLGVQEPSLRQNDFGGTFGGPVEIPALYRGKDRTFFFVSYEGLRLDQPQAANVTLVPDATLRASTPAPLQQVLNAFPVANGADNIADGIAQFESSWSTPSLLNSTSVRLDHSVNTKLRLFFRFSDTPSTHAIRESGTFANPAEYNSSRFASRTFTAGANSLFTSDLSNEFRFNYSSNHVAVSQAINSFGGNSPVDLAQLSGLDSSAQIAILLLGANDAGIEQTQLSGLQRQWNLVDTVGLVVGHHQFKFGVDYRRLAPTAINFDPSVDYLYFGMSSVQSNSSFAVAQSYASAFPLYTNVSAFAQDQWKVTPRLNVSLGLRWEVNPAPGVTQGLQPYAIEGSNPATATLAPEGTPLWKTTWFNFAPRLGVAYVLPHNAKYETVIRAGAGVFYDTGQQLGSTGFQGPGFTAESFISGPFPLPAAAAAPPIVNPPVPPYTTSIYVFPSDLQLPYTVQWNASIAQAFGTSQVLTVSYVGSHAARLLEQAEITNANAPALFFNKNGLTSDYDALQIQFQRRLSQGLTALASYTWSHCIDYGSQDYLLPYQRGDCDFDIRNNFSAAFSYDLPKVSPNGFLRAVLQRWGLDGRFTARTAFPVTLQGNPTVDPATGQTYYAGLNLVTGEPVYIRGSQCAAVYNNGLGCPGGRAINPNAFSLPSGLGDAPRNFTRGFGAWQMDSALRRDFPLYERLKLQFRAEAFNVFNHPNFGTINAIYCSVGPACTFGQATGTLASTLGILSPLYQQGGPRSLQFSLRLLF